MIDRNQIIKQADDDGVPAATVERDYVLNHALAAIANCEQAQQIVFKGGTALRLCYFDDYRYSADLDFSLIGGPGAQGTWLPTAALVVEIVSPGDETWEKLPFYAAHSVEEVLIVDPLERTVSWLGLTEGSYRELPHSALVELDVQQLAARIEWPADGPDPPPPTPVQNL